jgi:hypothetical protein
VDFKTTNRLLALMVERGMAKELVLNTATAIATPGMQSTRNDEVGCLVWPGAGHVVGQGTSTPIAVH